MTRKSPISAQALDFMVWREAQSVGWDCTVSELASAIGRPYTTAREVAIRRGWLERLTHGNSGAKGDRLGIDKVINSGVIYK